MVSLSIELRGADRLIRGLTGAEKALPGDLRGAMQDSLSLVKSDAQGRLNGYSLRRLAGSLETDISQRGTSLVGTVSTDRPSGVWVERGRRPGRRPPPVRALTGWAAEHGIPADALYPIARMIGRRGIPPRPFLTPALEKNRGRIEQRFRQLGARVVARIAGA